jgi:hypothetical protein
MIEILGSDGYLAALVFVLALEVGWLGLRALRRRFRYRPLSARAVRRINGRA